jgi:hypothetical protein
MRKDVIDNDPLVDEEENRSVSVIVGVKVSMDQPTEDVEL